MTARPKILALATFLLGATAGAARAAPVYVDASMFPGVGDGTSWGAAFERVQQGIDAAARAGGGEVWVREGTYYENVGIPGGVAVYGGFAGGEASLDERDPAAHVTVIDGGRLNTTVRISGPATTRIDGFTIQNGLNGVDRPGGMLGGGVTVSGAAVVANNVIRWNAVDPGWGGGVYVAAGSPLVTGNLIYENRASSGGGLFAISSSPRIEGNVATDNRPAGLAVWASSATIVNNIALRNDTGISLASSRSAYIGNNVCGNNGSGIAIDLDFSSVIANNYLFSNGAGVNSYNTVVSDPNAVVHNAFFQNSQVTSSTITLGAGNITASCLPNSLSLTGGFHLTPTSPCIDGGLTSAVPPALVTDLDGEPRVAGAAVDIGADEVNSPATLLALAGTPGKLHWFTTPVTVTLTASGGPDELAVNGTEYTVDRGAAWLPYSAPFTLAEEGLVTRLGYRSTASAGAEVITELAKEVVIGVDTRAPVLDVAIPTLPPAGWYTTAPTITVTTSDPLPGSGLEAVRWGCGTRAGTAYAGPFDFACDGAPSTLTVEATDRAGNVRTFRTSLMVDVVPPQTATWLNPWPSGGWLNTDTVATVSAGNVGSDVARVEYGFDGVTWQPYALPFVVSSEGRNVVYTRAWDALGRVGAVAQVSASIDRTPPVSTSVVAGTGAGGWYTSDVTVTVNGSDNLSGISQLRYSFDGGATWQYAGYGQVISVTAEGTTSLTFSAVDSAANVEPPRHEEVHIDRTPPTTTARIDGPQGVDTLYTGPVTITLTAVDPLSGVGATTYTVDRGAPQLYAGPFTVSGDGPHEVAYFSSDVAGNVEAPLPPPFGFRIDATPPTCTLTPSGVPGLAGWWTSPVTVVAGASDAQSVVTALEVSVDGGPWSPYAGPLTIGGEGMRVVACRATDSPGNVGTSQLGVPIDLVCPSTSASLAGTVGLAGWYTSNVTVSLTAADAASGVASTAYSMDGLLWFPYAGPFTVSAEGHTSVQYRSTDVAGCVAAPGAVDVAIDTIPPTVASTSPADGANRVSRTPVITVTYREPVGGGPALQGVTLTYRRGGRTYTVPLTRTVAGQVMTLRPTVTLPANTPMQVTLPTGAVQDVAGLRSPPGGFGFTTR